VASARQGAESLKTENRPKRRDTLAVAGLGCPGGLAEKALQLRVFAPLLFISAPPVPLSLTEENEGNETAVLPAAQEITRIGKIR
jgi:hypothetical protein